jgi:hypothetical protein
VEGNKIKREFTRSPTNLGVLSDDAQQTRIDHILYMGQQEEIKDARILPRRAYISKDHSTVQATIDVNPTAYNTQEDIQKAKASLHRRKFKTYQYTREGMKTKINSRDSLNRWCIDHLKRAAKEMNNHQEGICKGTTNAKPIQHPH